MGGWHILEGVVKFGKKKLIAYKTFKIKLSIFKALWMFTNYINIYYYYYDIYIIIFVTSFCNSLLFLFKLNINNILYL